MLRLDVVHWLHSELLPKPWWFFLWKNEEKEKNEQHLLEFFPRKVSSVRRTFHLIFHLRWHFNFVLLHSNFFPQFAFLPWEVDRERRPKTTRLLDFIILLFNMGSRDIFFKRNDSLKYGWKEERKGDGPRSLEGKRWQMCLSTSRINGWQLTIIIPRDCEQIVMLKQSIHSLHHHHLFLLPTTPLWHENRV